MADEKEFAVIELNELKWPPGLKVPSRRFRLLVAADVNHVSNNILYEFAQDALSNGLVYFCSWGSDCERFHDIVDEVIAADELGQRRFAPPTAEDVVMTTWHDNDSLEEALDFFGRCALPTDGYIEDSSFRVVMCLANRDWAAIATRFLRASASFI